MLVPKTPLLVLVSLSASRVAADFVRVLYQNDLTYDASSPTKPALFVSTPQPNADAVAGCSGYNETLYTGQVTPDIKDQLRYLVYRGELQNSTQLWVDSTVPASRTRRIKRQDDPSTLARVAKCRAYTIKSDSVDLVNCNVKLPSLCNNSPAPFSSSNTEFSPSSLVTVENNNKKKNKVVGYRDARTFRFLGLPFAAPPVGDLRFAAAQPAKPGAPGTLMQATQYGPPCIQVASIFGVLDNSVAREDCLYLNVFTPVLPTSSAPPPPSPRAKRQSQLGEGATYSVMAAKKPTQPLLPVAVWIYGGAFQEGTGNMIDYDGGNMASRGDIVVVTFIYRVGVLGNMASDELPGAQGITDQIQALKWVKDNIAQFGGDPAKVTIFGQSAGAQSVLALMSSTPAKGLFHAAISQSAPWAPFPNLDVYTKSLYPALLGSTSCSNPDCLRSLPAETFISESVNNAITGAAVVAMDAYAQLKQLTSATEPVLPVIGTGVVDGLFVKLIQEGKLPSAGIPLMMGNTRDEASLFTPGIPGLGSPVPASDALLEGLLPSAFADDTVAAILSNRDVFAFNNSNPDALRDLASELNTLDTWQCPLQQVMTFASLKRTFPALYSYRLDKGIPQSEYLPDVCTPSAPSGVQSICHSSDIFPTFANSALVSRGYDSSYNSLAFTQYVQDTWTSFVRTHDPRPAPAYLQARGRSYETTLRWSSTTPFGRFRLDADDAVHLLNDPPQNSGLLHRQECEILAGAGFAYEKV